MEMFGINFTELNAFDGLLDKPIFSVLTDRKNEESENIYGNFEELN